MLFCVQLFFAKEPIYQAKLDEMSQVADKMAPSLSSADKERLKRELNQLNADLSDTGLSAKEEEDKQQDGLNKWQDFVTKVAQIESTLEGANERGIYETPTSLPAAKDNSNLNKVSFSGVYWLFNFFKF